MPPCARRAAGEGVGQVSFELEALLGKPYGGGGHLGHGEAAVVLQSPGHASRFTRYGNRQSATAAGVVGQAFGHKSVTPGR